MSNKYNLLNEVRLLHNNKVYCGKVTAINTRYITLKDTKDDIDLDGVEPIHKVRILYDDMHYRVIQDITEDRLYLLKKELLNGL